MKFLKSISSSGEEVQLSYCDYGSGQPIVLMHGWPMSKEMWEYQVDPLVDAGYRVIKYDRRGFGKSDKPWNGYDYDTLADDLKAVLEILDLENVILVGFSMGGGEVARYFGKHGGMRVAKAVFIGSVTPMMAKSDSNPDGVPHDTFDGMIKQIKQDRIGFLDEFGKQFFGVNMLSHPVSAPLLEYYRSLCSVASQRSTLQCINSFAYTDFTADLKAVTVPTLIIHGDADKIVPIETTSHRAAQIIPNNEYIMYDGAPHGLFYTHKDKLNQDLISFFKR